MKTLRPCRRIGLALFVIVCASIAAGLAPQSATQPSTAPATPAPKANALEFVVLNTNKGAIVLELNREKAPISTANFLRYVDSQFYNGTVFHRVIPGFMIQGGGFTKEGVQKPTQDGISNEWQNGLKNTRGTIAMARLGGKPDSATSQFFINVVDNGMLDQSRDGAGYAVFGKVVAGMNVVDSIVSEETHVRKGMGDWPREDIIIESAKAISADDAKKLIAAEKSAAPKAP
jgi:peptidyl-prolyl cis-trans isomerase A (cyclophilin A)